MKLLYLVHQFLPEYYAGTEKFVFNISSMIQKSGNVVKVVTYSFYDDSFYDKKVGHLMIKEFTYKGIPVIAIKHGDTTSDINLNLVDKDMYELAKIIITKEEPDIIHIGHIMRLTSEWIRASRELNKPYIITLTDFFLICPKITLQASTNVLCSGPEGGIACHKLCPEIPSYLVEKRVEIIEDILLNAARVISPSKFLASIFMKEFQNLKIETLNHGISYSKIKQNRTIYKEGHDLHFGYAGSISPHKGVHILLDAFRGVDFDNIYLKIYGSGPDAMYIKNLKNMVKDDARIEFCGVFSEEQVGDIFSQIDIIVIPSICYESYSLVMHESLACNVPVIVSNIGGTAEKIENEVTGYTFKVGASNNLKDIISYITENPEKINDIKINIKRLIIPSVEQEAYAYERIYKKVCMK